MQPAVAFRVIVLAAAFATVSAQAPHSESFRVRGLIYDARVDFPTQTLVASATYDLENWTPHASASVSFLLGRLMEVSRVRDAAGKSLAFTQDVVRLSDDRMRQVDRIVVRLPRPVAAGARTTLRIEYAGSIVPYTEVGWLYVHDHIDTAFTIIRQDALAFPSVGGISDKANRTVPRVDYTYDASVTVPQRFIVATGGVASHTDNADGTITWRYRSGKPSPFLNISIAPFDTVSGSGVHVFYLPADSAGARRLLASAQRAIAALTESFGPLHDTLNLAITEIPDDWGSQADLVGGIIQTAAAFRDTTRIGELYHELSHLWNAPETSSPPARWNEGLAMFEEHLLRERADGWGDRSGTDSATIVRLRRRLATDTLLRAVPFVDYGSRRMTDNSYTVGDVMFATLYELIGPTEFNRIVGGWYEQHPRGGTTREFVEWAEHTASRNLTQFFDHWMFSTRWTGFINDATSIRDLADRYR
jgi:hypothetical protein